ncbi:MAG: flagellar biosynthetic protein FliR [Lachnospiraceae bacterium]|nr:flagellar biosynthetic protein FliR [Lachnospiraceae bacterium]
MDLSIETLKLEAFLLVLVRIACFVAIAPVFGHKSINARLRVLIAACISLTVFMAMDPDMPEYNTVFGFSFLLIKEAAIGLALGFVSSLVMSIISMAGEFIDREIGISMAQSFDINTGTMTTITANLYDKMVYLVILITNLHYYILKAVVRSFEIVPLGSFNMNIPVMYTQVLGFVIEFFLIGFRIAMPIFIAATIINIILGVMTKSSPQMNMFAIGIQMKIILGMLALAIMIMFVPNITNYLMEKMDSMLSSLLGGM